MCFVWLLVCAGCGPVDHPGDGDTDPTDLGGGGDWEGSNCMGAAYGITLLDDFGQEVTVRQSTAIGVVVDSLGLSASTNDDGGVEVEITGLDVFLAVGLRNWLHKIGETLLPNADWIASYDPDNNEYGRGHYNVLGLHGVCDPIPTSLSPVHARTLAMFLLALSQMASCPDPEVAEEDGNFVAVPVRLEPTEQLADELPSSPDAPTLYELYRSFGAEPVLPGNAPDPTMTCILWDFDDGVLAHTLAPPPDAQCLWQAQVESIVTTVARSEEPFDDGGAAGEPVAFTTKPVLAPVNALGAATPVRHLLADYHVGVVTRINSYTTCDDDIYDEYATGANPCPATKTRLHFRNARVEHRAGALPMRLEYELGTIFSRGTIEEAIVVIIPTNATPRCMYECPPESPSPSDSETCE
jgi:hypothetical protein